MADAGVKIPTFSERSSNSGRRVERRNILAVKPCGTTSAGVTAGVTWRTEAGRIGQEDDWISCGPTLYANSEMGGVPSLPESRQTPDLQQWLTRASPAG